MGRNIVNPRSNSSCRENTIYFPTVKKIRISIGSAISLGLSKGWVEIPPSTIYLLTYHDGKCISNCGFCTQARSSTSKADKLSRVTWPIFEFEDVILSLRSLDSERIERICLQSLYYNGFFEEVSFIISRIKGNTDLPLSLSCQPLTIRQLKRLKALGLDNVCIPLDAATKKIFDRVKGSGVKSPYRWESHIAKLEQAVIIFKRRNVSTHLIVGIGENDREILSTIQYLTDLGVVSSLFAFTPLPGTRLQHNPRPPVEKYRMLQIANYLINNELIRISSIDFRSDGMLRKMRVPEMEMKNIIEKGIPFKTYGCKGCNRPYYNENVRGPLYNYPDYPTPSQVEDIIATINEFIEIG